MRIDFDNASAMAPFFEDRVGYAGDRPCARIRGTFACCLLFGANVDALSDISPASASTSLTCLLAKRGPRAWNLTTSPQAGDILTLPDGRQYAINNVDDWQSDYYTLEAAQC